MHRTSNGEQDELSKPVFSIASIVWLSWAIGQKLQFRNNRSDILADGSLVQIRKRRIRGRIVETVNSPILGAGMSRHYL